MGERIGGGLRRLIAATERLQAGDLDARAGVRRDDELGVLGASFDAMAASLRATTDELRRSRGRRGPPPGPARGRVRRHGRGAARLRPRPVRDRVQPGRRPSCWASTRVAVRGRPIDDVVRFTPSDQRRDRRRRRAGPRRHRVRRARCGRATGQVPVHVTAGPLLGEDDRVVGAVFVLRDMRRERQAEQAKADLLATISHELRTPAHADQGLRRDAPHAVAPTPARRSASPTRSPAASTGSSG